MNIYEFGKNNRRKLLFFQGSCTSWKDYLPSIELLARRYHVIVPAYDGHEPEEKTDFISVEKTVDDTSRYLLEHGYDELHAVYGLSIGGGMVLRLLTEGKIVVHKVIIDGGIAPYEMPHWLTRLILVRDFLMIMFIRSSYFVFKLFIDPKRWTPEDGDEEKYKEGFYFLKGLSRKSVWNIFDSANNYDMPEPLPDLYAKIQFWFGSLEKNARKRDIKWVLKHVKGVQMWEIPNMEHGELVIMHPQLFFERAMDFLV